MDSFVVSAWMFFISVLVALVLTIWMMVIISRMIRSVERMKESCHAGRTAATTPDVGR